MSIKKVFFICLLALALVHGGYELSRSLFGPAQGLDFAQYYVASRLILDGESLIIYDKGDAYQNKAKEYGVQSVKVGPIKNFVMTNTYPPFVSFFMIPFSVFSYDHSRYLFFFVSILCNICAIPLLFSNRSKDRRKELILIGLLITFIFYPIYYSLNMGQINSILFLFCALALFFIRRQRLWLAGLFIALASLIKIFPLVLIPFFILKRQYKIIGTTIVSMVLLVGLSMVVLDLKLYTFFFEEVLPGSVLSGAFYRNQGFVAFFSRLFTQNPYVESIGHYPNTALFLALAASIIAMSVALLCTRGSRDSGTFRYDVEYGLYFVVIILVLGKSWEHGATFLLFSYLFLFEFLVYEYYKHPKGQFVLFFISLSFCIWSFVLTSDSEYEKLFSFDNVLMNLIISSKFFATLLLFICNIWILYKKPENALLVKVDTRSSRLFN